MGVGDPVARERGRICASRDSTVGVNRYACVGGGHNSGRRQVDVVGVDHDPVYVGGTDIKRVSVLRETSTGANLTRTAELREHESSAAESYRTVGRENPAAVGIRGALFDEREHARRHIGITVRIVGPIRCTARLDDIDAVLRGSILVLDENPVACHERDAVKLVTVLESRGDDDVRGRGSPDRVLDVETLLHCVNILFGSKLLAVAVYGTADEEVGTVGNVNVTGTVRVQRDVAVAVRRADRVARKIHIANLSDRVGKADPRRGAVANLDLTGVRLESHLSRREGRVEGGPRIRGAPSKLNDRFCCHLFSFWLITRNI